MPTQNIYDLVDTWASGGGPYTSIKMNATDNDTGSASLLMDLGTGGGTFVSRFKVDKNGTATGASFRVGTSIAIAVNTGSDINLTPLGQFSWGSSTAVSSADLILTRRAAANLRFGAADAATAQPQILSVQSVVAGTTNTAGANLTITGSQGTGTGAGGSIIFQVAPAGSSGSAQNALATALTIDSNRALSGYTNSNLFSQNAVNINGCLFGAQIIGVGGNFLLNGANPTVGFALASTMPLSWSANSGVTDYSNLNTPDVKLYRDDANKLALRNGTAAQEMRVYETTTGTIYKAILGNRQLIKIAGAAFDNGAGASAGTLTNAPAVGNPTKWIPIDDNGTTRHIPAW